MSEEGHSHSHDYLLRKGVHERRTLTFVLCLTAGFMLFEALAGYYTNSLALLSDSAHMLTDVVAISLALVALWFSQKPPTSTKTFGFYRAEVLAAFFNSLLLFAITIGIGIEAYKRIMNPNEVKSLEMMLVAVIGLIVNIIGVYALSKHRRNNLNMRGAFFHIFSDALGSVGAIIAGLVMLKTDWYYADPIISTLIGCLILKGAWDLFRESVHILLEGTPRRINLKSVENAISSHNDVLGVHDLHAWTLTRGFEALSAHLVIKDLKSSESVIRDVKRHLYDKFQISHVTLQLETMECEPGDMNCYDLKKQSMY